MVLAGQFLERSVVVRSGELSLDALYHRGRRRPPCAIASPHPALGGSMAVPAVAELAWALTRAAFPTLRFDYRGVGASQGRSRHAAGGGRIQDVSEEVADLRAAIAHLLQTTQVQSACAVGYSFGAAVALQAAHDPEVERLVLIAPPTALWDFSSLGDVRKPVLVVCAHHDPLCERGRIHLPKEGQLAVIPHADHAFHRGLQELGKTVADWAGSGQPEMPVASAGVAEPESLRELELEETDDPPLELDE
jgi:uncharacterized protein